LSFFPPLVSSSFSFCPSNTCSLSFSSSLISSIPCFASSSLFMHCSISWPLLHFFDSSTSILVSLSFAFSSPSNLNCWVHDVLGTSNCWTTLSATSSKVGVSSAVWKCFFVGEFFGTVEFSWLLVSYSQN
jgi:hypothetical protein